MCKMRIAIELNIGIEELNRLNTCINETLKILLGTKIEPRRFAQKT